MDYEKEYYIALDKARLLHHNLVKYGVKIITKDIEDIFPELKESENKRMIQYFKDLAPFDKADELYEKYGFSHKDAIAWLEKQKGTEREIEGNSLCNGEQKPVEEYSFNIESELFHQLTLAQQGLWRKEIEQAYNAGADTQKPAWSEEDERMCQETIDWFEKKCFPYALESENPAIESINWLKSLKERCAWKPSEEQITCLHDAVARYNQEGFSAATLTSLLEQLKKLREE